jgi:hypothetical protein
MIRLVLAIVGVLTLMLIAFVGGYHARATPETRSVPTLERLSAMGRLDVLRVEPSDIRQSSISGYTGSGSILLILRGQVVVGVDVTKATLIREGDVYVLMLPPPEVTVTRVDAEQSRVYRIDRDGLWQMAPSDELSVALINKALTDAQHALIVAGRSDAILTPARHAAEHLIHQWTTAHGWPVQIRWQDPPSTQPTGTP